MSEAAEREAPYPGSARSPQSFPMVDHAASKPVGTKSADGPRHIDAIDSLRAVAMTAVIAEHCKIMPFGWMGVWLFFVISGFVVTTSLMARSTERPGPLLAHFYTRRAARILPIYLGFVVVGFLVSGAFLGHLEWKPFASLVLFYNNFQSAFDIGTFKYFRVGHLWTISVEMQFYLFFGLAYAFLSRRALSRVLIGLLVLAPILRFIGGEWLAQAGFSPLRAAFAVYSFSLMHFDSFAIGALLALGREQWSQVRRARALWALGVTAMILYAAAYVWVNHTHGLHGVRLLRDVISGILIGDQRQVWLYSAVALLSAGALAMTLTGKAPWSPIARIGILQAVGRVSYGGYIYHPLCVFWIGAGLGLVISPGGHLIGKLAFGVLRFALALPATLALALLSYRFIERPIMLQVSRRLSPRPA